MAKEKNSKQDQTKQLLEKAENGVREVFDSEKYKNYLLTMSKFHSYSFRNSILIFLQRPSATLVAGYNAWSKNFNRQVNRGEKGIQIIGYTPFKRVEDIALTDEKGEVVLDKNGEAVTEKKEIKVPGFKPVYVYDVSQTSGEPLPSLVENLEGSVQGYKDLLQALTDISPFKISFEQLYETKRGYCDPTKQEIVIQEGMSQPQTIKTVIHEITHAILHAPEVNARFKETVDRNTKEVQAESTAFVVCAHCGIDTSQYTFPYVASWSSGKEIKELQDSLEVIQKQANDLITKIDQRLVEIHKSHEIQIASPETVKEIIKDFSDSMSIDNKTSRPVKSMSERLAEAEQKSKEAAADKDKVTDRKKERKEVRE